MVKQTVRIYARVRPLRDGRADTTVRIRDAHSLEVGGSRVTKDGADAAHNLGFRFNQVFGPASSQEELYAAIVRPLVDDFMRGVNCSVLSFGQTGSGKTYTISGGDKYKNRGVTPRAIADIFAILARESADAPTSGAADGAKPADTAASGAAAAAQPPASPPWRLFVSYLEIYNETVYDLLNTSNGDKPIEAWERVVVQHLPASGKGSSDSGSSAGGGQLLMRGLRQFEAKSAKDVQALLILGNGNRMSAETPMNQCSSRSHAIFTLTLERRPAADSDVILTSKFHFVDLAGSERIFKTGAGASMGTGGGIGSGARGRSPSPGPAGSAGSGSGSGGLLTSAGSSRDLALLRQEGRYINLSLHHLEQVIIALHAKAVRAAAHAAAVAAAAGGFGVDGEGDAASDAGAGMVARPATGARGRSGSTTSLGSRGGLPLGAGAAGTDGHGRRVSVSSADSSPSAAAAAVVVAGGMPSVRSTSSSATGARARSGSRGRTPSGAGNGIAISAGFGGRPGLISASSSVAGDLPSPASSVAPPSVGTPSSVHVPYRNSMLTSVLRDSLGGNCSTVLIATLNPEEEYADESVSTCRFASRCGQLTNDVSANTRRDLSATVAMLQRENEALKAALDRERAAKDEADATIRALQELLREARGTDGTGSGGRAGGRSAPSTPAVATAADRICSACGASGSPASAALTARPALALSPQPHISERMRLTAPGDAALVAATTVAPSLATASSPVALTAAADGAPVVTASFSLASRLKAAGTSGAAGSAPGSVMVAILPPATRGAIGSRIADWLQEASATSPSIDSLAAAEEATAAAGATETGGIAAGRSRGGLRTLTISTADGVPTTPPLSAGEHPSPALTALHDLVSRMKLRNLSEAYAAVDQMLAPLVQAVNACAQAVAECEHERATAAASSSTISSLRALAARHEREAGVWESKYARLLRDYDDLNRAAMGMSQTMQTLQASIDDLRMRAPVAPAVAVVAAAAPAAATDDLTDQAATAAAPAGRDPVSGMATVAEPPVAAAGPAAGPAVSAPLSAASSASSLVTLTHAASSASLAALPVPEDAGRATPVAAQSPLAAVAAETAAAAGSSASSMPPAAASSGGSSRSVDAATAHAPRDAATAAAAAPPRPTQLQPSLSSTVQQHHPSPGVDGVAAAAAVRDMLVAGALFVKHGRMGRPHLRYVWCDGDLLGIHWRAIGSGRAHTGKGSMPLASVLDVVPGRSTAVFARNSGGHSGREQACFSLVAADRTLDLEVEWQGGSAAAGGAATASAASSTAPAAASGVTPADIAQRDAWVEALKCLISAWKLVKRATAQAEAAVASGGAAGALPIDDADADSDADGSSVGSSHVSRLATGLGHSAAAGVNVMDALAVVMSRKQRATGHGGSGATISPASSSSTSSTGRGTIGIDRFRAGAPFPPLGGAAAAGITGRSRGGDASFESMRSSIDGLEATWVSDEGPATDR